MPKKSARLLPATSLALLILLAGAAWAAAQPSPQTDAAGIEFFEKRIRPVLIEHCYECHSARSDKVKGGLRLDTRADLLKGGDTGPAIVPGDPDRSLLIKAVGYLDEDLQMPPKNKKLSEPQIHDLEAWVKMGAPDPRTGAETPAPGRPAAAHWAFDPVRPPLIPPVKNRRWVQTPVDAFVLARLEGKGLAPSRRADRRILIRRATLDLTGLPPAPEEVAAFVADRSPEAFARVVDRLLASAQYGERWARHWLDVSRYADSKGYVFEEERRYPYAFTYRDYVIRAFNQDLPFDRFIREQLAADLLDLGEDKRPLAALGFLTLGRRFLNNTHDIIDDRIDVVTRGFLGLTVTCARCHDHKYDPIPTEDYYSLYGVFASCNEPGEKPLLGKFAESPAYDRYLAERKKRQDELDQFKQDSEAQAFSNLRLGVGDYLLAAHDAGRLEDKSKTEGLARERKLDPNVLRNWITRLNEWKKEHHPIFAPWLAFSELPESEFGERAAVIAAQLSANSETQHPIHPRVAKAFRAEPPRSINEAAERYGALFAEAEKAWQTLAGGTNAVPGAAGRLPDSNLESLRGILYGDRSPLELSSGEINRLFDVPTAQKLRRLRRQLEELDATHPGSPPRAMALIDNPTPHQPRVFVRGNPNNAGREVPRQFLSVLAREEREPFQNGSGRLELARAIASRDNPLTARVLVNRVWLHHFGAGLVRTPSDFGLRAEVPTHPDLLDYLAWQFMEQGWSLKQLHRLILLSNTYQQTSEINRRYAEIDPNNLLLWRMNRRRLELEAFRDTLLAVSGKLDLTAGGRPVEITTEPSSPRRTVYGFVERQNLPGLFRTFDFASPDTTSPQRFYTTIPQQALFLLNSPFLIDQARHLAQRAAGDTRASPEARIRDLYQIVFQREPGPDELRLALQFIRQERLPGPVPDPPAWQYGFGQYDAEIGQVKEFRPLPHFTGSAWQGGPKLPDDKLGWLMLNADGGHPGEGLAQVVVRRWVAPRSGPISITGELTHEPDKGDGVRARILFGRTGTLGEWTVKKDKSETKIDPLEVQAGDRIDFVVDSRESIDSDSFHWVLVVKAVNSEYAPPSADRNLWNSKQDFADPQEPVQPLGAWEKLAQVLLMSNELVFVD